MRTQIDEPKLILIWIVIMSILVITLMILGLLSPTDPPIDYYIK